MNTRLIKAGLEQIGTGLGIFDEAMTLAFWTRRYLDCLGVSASQVGVGTSLEDLVRIQLDGGPCGDEARVTSAEAYCARLRRGESFALECERGGVVLEWRYRPTDGGGVVVTCEDVTQRRWAQSALRTTERRLRAIVDHTPSGVTLKDAEGRYLLTNEGFARRRGVSPDHLLGKTVKDLFPDDVAERAERLDREVLAEGKASQVEIEATDVDGVTRLFLATKFPVHGDLGEPVAVGTILTDITERTRAEQSLLEQERHFRAIIDHSSAGIYLKDLEGRYVLVNKAFAGYRGVTVEQCVGRTTHDFFPDAIADYLVSDEVEIRRTGKASVREVRIRRANGVVATVLAIKFPVLGPDGATTGIGAIFSDVTEQKRLEEGLRRAKLDAEERSRAMEAMQADLLSAERLAALGKVIAMVSHELRNPLGTIRTDVFALQRSLKPAPGPAKNRFDRIDRNIVRCVRIIDELLDYARTRTVQMGSVNLDDWARGVFDDLELPPAVRLHTRFEAGANVTVDADRLRQALVNVVQNAWQAMTGSEDADPSGDLLVTTERTPDRVEIRVSDSGPGVDPDVRDKIFEPLFSTKGFGVGLGLSVVEQVMRQHGGGVEIADSPSGGATVVLWVPFRAE